MPTILLTGATGFVGSHLLAAIQNHSVYSKYKLVLLSSRQVSGYNTILHQDYSFKKDDFTKAGVNNIEIVIHAGAFIPKNNNDANNVSEATSNIFSSKYLIEQLPNIPESFIFLSTVDVYKGSGDQVITEDTFTEPVSLYGWSKLYGEKLLEAWAKKENAVVQILRLGHIYGSGEEHFQKIIPLTIRKVIQQQKPVIFTKGDELRSFLHISDCVASILAAIELKEYKGPINIVSSRALRVKEIVSTIVNQINPAIGIDIQGNDMPVRNLVFDNSKMQKLLSKECMIFEEGIKEEISGFKL